MSTNEWEQGSIKIPAKEWSSFKKTIIDSFNKEQDDIFEISKAMYVYLKMSLKGKRNITQNDIEEKFIEVFNNKHIFNLPQKEISEADQNYLKISSRERPIDIRNINKINKMDDHDIYKIKNLIISGNKIHKPKKKDLEYANYKTDYIEAGAFASIQLNQEEKIVIWTVSENNHAVEESRNSKLGKLLFKELNSIHFTSRTGGEIIGNDEINRDDGDGTNYVTATFEKEKPNKKRRLKYR